MQAQGDCVNKDERCERIDHPLSYYDDAVAAADGVTDWRQRRESR
jgi:DNA primase large subunit